MSKIETFKSYILLYSLYISLSLYIFERLINKQLSYYIWYLESFRLLFRLSSFSRFDVLSLLLWLLPLLKWFESSGLLKSLLLNGGDSVYPCRLFWRFLGLIGLFVVIEGVSDISNAEMLLNIIVIAALSLNTSNITNIIGIIDDIDGADSDRLLE